MPTHGTTGGDTGSGAGVDTGGTGGGQQPADTAGNTTDGELRADPGRMHGAARLFDTSADYAAGMESRFLSGTAGLTGVWGTDDTGKKFEGPYLERLKNATDAMKSIREGLAAVPESVDAWAQAYEQAAEDNATIADGVGRAVGGDTS